MTPPQSAQQQPTSGHWWTGLRLAIASALVGLSLLGLGLPRPLEPTRVDPRVAWKAMTGDNPHPAFAFVEDDRELPRVLLIGDSISVYYTLEVRRLLAGKANVHRIPVNGGDTNRGLRKLSRWLGSSHWDVIHFNFGLHDLRREKQGSSRRRLTPGAYRHNLQLIVQSLQQTDAALVWAATTPIPEGADRDRWVKGDELIYNRVAASVMKQHAIPVNDLHARVATQLSRWQKPADVHFTADGSELLGGLVAAAISRRLR